MYNQSFTSHQISFLKRMNSLLSEKEVELFERARRLVESYQKRLVKHGGDLNDYEIEVLVEYNLLGNFPKYIYSITINKEMFDGKSQTFGSDKDWSEESSPVLGEKWCYLMHSLYSHSKIDTSLFKIINIEFEILIREQQTIRNVDYESFG